MSDQTLSKQALQIIEDYQDLSIGKDKIVCPYFNNRRSGIRGALAVLIGKGTPGQIEEEAMLFGLREKIDLDSLNKKDLKKFLVDHNLGIDCSGFVFHVLDAELDGIKKHLKHPWIKNPIRKLIAKLRIVENTGVSTFNNDINTEEVKLSGVKPGDLIIMMNTGLKNDMHHILLVSKVESRKSKVINYVHSFQFTTDGKYDHGIKEGEIKIIDPKKGLLEQEWNEVETYNHAKMAKKLKIGRLN
jgi:hypothetical protein